MPEFNKGGRLPALMLLLVLFAGLSTLAVAHDVPQSVVMLDIGEHAVNAELQLPLSELGKAMSLQLAEHPQQAIAAHAAEISRYAGRWLQAASPAGHPFAVSISSLALHTTSNPNWQSNDWVVVNAVLTPPAAAATSSFYLDYQLISQKVLSHNTLIYVRHDIRNGVVGDQPLMLAVAGFGNTHIKVDGSNGSWLQGFCHLFLMGMRHIMAGTDHILFLLTLLLAAPMVEKSGRWAGNKGMGTTIRATVRVVSGFTLGHSISLALAATRMVAVPAPLIESLIAFSILVTSIHVWRPLFARKDIWVASGFGLIHGFGLAEALAGLDFDKTTLAISLLGFNLGVEAMQLLIIAATLPLIIGLCAKRNLLPLRTGLAAFAFICASGWLAERALHLNNPLQALMVWMSPPPSWFIAGLCLMSVVAAMRLKQPA